jgi:hypothetical protein
VARGDDLIGSRDIDLPDSDGHAEQHSLEGKLDVLLDCRVETDGLLGLRVRIDDGLDQGIEMASRNPGTPDVFRASTCQLSRFVTFCSPRHTAPLSAALKRTEDVGFRVYFRAYRPDGLSLSPEMRTRRAESRHTQGVDIARSRPSRRPRRA